MKLDGKLWDRITSICDVAFGFRPDRMTYIGASNFITQFRVENEDTFYSISLDDNTVLYSFEKLKS